MESKLERGARRFAEAAHRGQVRKGSEIPYITHPVAVAGYVKQVGGSEEVVAAAFLHDVIEDCGVTETELRKRFGAEVARIVRGCSEARRELGWHERKKATLDRLMEADEKVLLVSCADKLHNLECVLKDYEEVGGKLWKRFKVGARDQIWYYTELGKIFEKRLGSSWITLWYLEALKGLGKVRVKGKGAMVAAQELWE